MKEKIGIFVMAASIGASISLLIFDISFNIKFREFKHEAIAHGAATYVIEDGSPVFKWNDEVKK